MNFLRRRSMMSRAGVLDLRRDVGEAVRDRSTSSPMSRARAPVAFGGGYEARARRSRYVSRVLAGTRGRARVRGLLRTDFATSTASSGALDALNAFGAAPRGARRAIDSEGGGQRDPTPKTARERAQRPRRRARDGDAGVDVLKRREARGPSEHELPTWPGVGELSPDSDSRTSTPPAPLCSHIVPPKSRPLWRPAPSADACGSTVLVYTRLGGARPGPGVPPA